MGSGLWEGPSEGKSCLRRGGEKSPRCLPDLSASVSAGARERGQAGPGLCPHLALHVARMDIGSPTLGPRPCCLTCGSVPASRDRNRQHCLPLPVSPGAALTSLCVASAGPERVCCSVLWCGSVAGRSSAQQCAGLCVVGAGTSVAGGPLLAAGQLLFSFPLLMVSMETWSRPSARLVPTGQSCHLLGPEAWRSVCGTLDLISSNSGTLKRHYHSGMLTGGSETPWAIVPEVGRELEVRFPPK